MKIKKINSFNVIGISVRTQNHQDNTLQDMNNLWMKFMGEQISNNIPNKQSEDIYAVYTHYDGDYNQPYTMILGHVVDSLETIPEGMSGVSIEEGNYLPMVAKGDLNEGVVYKAWESIWQSDYPRAYTADFEVYGNKTVDPNDAEVDIFIAVK